MRHAAFLAITLGVAGCSLFVDLNGLNGGGGSDVFVPADVAVEAAPGVDASDAGPAVDAAHFQCPDASIVCDDFDEKPLGALWSRVTNQNGTLVIDDAAVYSPPDSLHIVLPDNPGSSLVRLNRLEEDVNGLTSLQCELRVRLAATDSTGSSYDAALFSVVLTVPGYNDYELQINLQATGLYYEQDTDNGQDGGALTSSEPFTAMVPGVWRHVRIATDFKRTQLEVDGVQVYDNALVTPLPTATATGTFYVGQVADTEPPAWEYSIDDVICVGQ